MPWWPIRIRIYRFKTGVLHCRPCLVAIAIRSATFSGSSPLVIATHEKLFVLVCSCLVVLVKGRQVEDVHIFARRGVRNQGSGHAPCLMSFSPNGTLRFVKK